MKRFWRNVLTAVVAVAAGLAGGGRAWGEQVTYYVDPARSSLTLSGSWEGYDLMPSAPNSLTASYTGNISANRDVGGNTLQLLGGYIAAQDGDGMSPITGKPAEYAFKPSHRDPEGGARFAIQELTFGANSAEITSPSNFDASRISMVIEKGKLDFDSFWPGSSVVPLSGNLSLAPASATLLRSGNFETLFIPFDTDFSVLISAQGSTPEPLSIHLSGQLVAVTPEPTSLALLLPAILLARRSRGGARSDRAH